MSLHIGLYDGVAVLKVYTIINTVNYFGNHIHRMVSTVYHNSTQTVVLIATYTLIITYYIIKV